MKNQNLFTFSDPEDIQKDWANNMRWNGINRPYKAEDVVKLRGSIKIENTLANMGSRKLWSLLNKKEFVAALGAITGGQAVQQVTAGLRAIYCSGWQVAADANTANQTYPDQSIYPADSVPKLVQRINNALRREDEKQTLSSKNHIDWFAPIVADAEAGFGSAVNIFEITKAMIRAGASGIHYEDQLASEKKCGHMGGKVIIPTREFVRKLVTARLASDILDVPTIIVARTDANGAKLIANDIDPIDHKFITRERTAEGFYRIRGGLECAIERGLSYAPFADMLWCETSKPDIGEAREFAQAIHEQFPNKLLMYNCSPSFNWRRNLSEEAISNFQNDLANLGYRFQFITLAGFHSLNYAMFELAYKFRDSGMTAFSDLQRSEFIAEEYGFSATRHQEFVGTKYFDEVTRVVSESMPSTLALEGSTEEEQF
jgi:isocitrate lyase